MLLINLYISRHCCVGWEVSPLYCIDMRRLINFNDQALSVWSLMMFIYVEKLKSRMFLYRCFFSSYSFRTHKLWLWWLWCWIWKGIFILFFDSNLLLQFLVFDARWWIKGCVKENPLFIFIKIFLSEWIFFSLWLKLLEGIEYVGGENCFVRILTVNIFWWGKCCWVWYCYWSFLNFIWKDLHLCRIEIELLRISKSYFFEFQFWSKNYCHYRLNYRNFPSLSWKLL